MTLVIRGLYDSGAFEFISISRRQKIENKVVCHWFALLD